MLEDAGRQAIPFTTGILVGIGETYAERADSLFAIRRVAREYGGIQEVIVQNFRAKPDTAMRGDPGRRPGRPGRHDRRRPAGARPEDAHPGAAQPRRRRVRGRLLAAGIDDWGGVSPLTPDHVNPERPWPQIDALAAAHGEAGFELRERLTVYPEYVAAGEPWLDPRDRAARRRAGRPGDRAGRREPTAAPVGPWQEPDGGAGRRYTGRTDLHTAIDTEGRTGDRRGDFDDVYGDWDALERRRDPGAPCGPNGSTRMRRCARHALRRAADDPAGISDDDALALFDRRPARRSTLAALADDVRRDAVGDDVTYVVNRNINFTNVCYTGCRFCAFAQRRTDADAYTLSLAEVGDRAEEAWDVGATEVCMQGGIHPDLPGTAYFDIAAEVKRRAPDMHVHAFSPMEVVNGVARTGLSVRDWLAKAKDAGLDTIPGTAAEILDDDVRWVLTKGKLPTAAWIEVVTTAHRLGIPTTSTMMYGHVDTPGALGRAPAAAGPHPGRDRRLHRVRAAAVRAPERADLPGRAGPAGPDRAGEPRRARDGPAAAARPDRQHPVLLGQARRGRLPAGAARRRQRPRRHADGGDDQPDGRLGARQPALGAAAGGDGGQRRPAGPAAHHDVRRGARAPPPRPPSAAAATGAPAMKDGPGVAEFASTVL